MDSFDVLPPSISDSDAERIIRDLYADRSSPGDKEALISGYMRFVWLIAKKINRHSSTFQDVFQAGCLELVEVINDVFSFRKIMYDHMIAMVINKNVSHRCKDVVENSRPARMPGRTIRLKMASGLNPSGQILRDFNELSVEARLIIQLLPPIYQNDFIHIAKNLDLPELRRQVKTKLFSLIAVPKFSDSSDVHLVKARQDQPCIELLELLNKATCSFREAEILKMRSEGYTYNEIAAKYFMTAPQIGNYVHRIEERFDRLMANEAKVK